MTAELFRILPNILIRPQFFRKPLFLDELFHSRPIEDRSFKYIIRGVGLHSRAERRDVDAHRTQKHVALEIDCRLGVDEC